MSGHPVDVFICETSSLSTAHVFDMLSVLSHEERARQARFAFPMDGRDYVASHTLLRVALARSTGMASHRLRFNVTPGRQPTLAPTREGAPTPSFSLTHSRGLVACAVRASGFVGADVEPVDGSVRALEIARRFFSPEEAAALERCASNEVAVRFSELWTLKEAFAKALGAGIARSLRTPWFAVGAAGMQAYGARGWAFISADVGGTHRLAVAVDQRVDVRLSLIDPFALPQGAIRTSALTVARPGDQVTVIRCLGQLLSRDTAECSELPRHGE